LRGHIPGSVLVYQEIVRQQLVENAIKLCSNDSMHQGIYIGLGANMGDREHNLLRAVAELGKLPGTKIAALSSFYDSEPVGPVPQDNFLNGVLAMESTLPPRELLQELLRIEVTVFKRRRGIPLGPRTMDLDLLLYGNEIIAAAPELIVPHPRLHERRFMLLPLHEIAPDLVHPVLGKTVHTLLKELPDKGRVTRI
jgi:2-amino-4-hydroxy-6-hydroxymethyldihydropteridine diphosphokinase